MDKRIGQLFIIGLNGKTLEPAEADFIVQNNIGGVILFDRNIESPEQIHKLCADVQALSKKTEDKHPLFISIDMEGGRVARLKPPFTQWPPLRKIGDADSTSLAFKFSQCMGNELNSIGVNLNYAPCVDLYTNPKNEIIGDRSLGSDPELVSKVASALVRGYIKSDVIACAKHFPGHGNTLLDSHEDLPVEESTLEELYARELIPFKKTFRARLDMVMTAHIKFKNVDPEYPATLSKKFLTEIIRDDFRFNGIVISDDLDMKALTKNYSVEEIPVLALNAGCDMALYCNNPESHKIGLESVRKAATEGRLSDEQIQKSYDRIIQLKSKKMAKFKVMTFDEAKSIIGHPDHMRLAKAIDSGEIPEEFKTT